jgi:hypothetical protein
LKPTSWSPKKPETNPTKITEADPAKHHEKTRSLSFSVPSRERVQRQSIFFPASFRQTLDSLSTLTLAHQQRFQFYFAVALVSAPAEAAVKIVCNGSQASDNGNPGHAWQRSVFGGVILEQSREPLV